MLTSRRVNTQLELIKYVVQQQLVEHELERMHTEVMLGRVADSLVVGLKTQLYGSRLDRADEEIRVPATWWDHFKQWVRERRVWWLRWVVWWCSAPRVKVHRITCEGRLLFPDIPVELRQQQRNIMVSNVSTSIGWDDG